MAYQVYIQSQLMKNHVAGKVLPAQRNLGLAVDALGSAVLFSLDDQHLFEVSIRSDATTSGWAQIDLGAQLPEVGGSVPAVQTFAASLGPTGSIWIAVATVPAGGAGSRIFVSKALPEQATLSDWQDFGAQLIERPLPEAIDVERLSLGVGVGSDPIPLLVLEGKDTAGEIQHYQVNPDPSDTNWAAEKIVMPENSTKCLAARPGYLQAHGLGVYTLCELATRKNLNFTPMPQYYNGHPVTKPAIDLGLPGGLEPQSISVVPLEDLQTELYVGGQGLARYDIASQATSNLPGAIIEDGTYFDAVTKLEVRRDAKSGNVGVWGLVKGDVLMFTRGAPSGATQGEWQTPLPLDIEVTALAALVTGPDAGGASSLIAAAGYSDGTLALTTQDPATQLWRKEQVSKSTVDDVVEIDTYTTRIVVREASGVPANQADVELSASFDCAASINGRYRVLKAGIPKTVTTTPSGVVTIVLQTKSLESPVYTIAAAGESQMMNPMDTIRDEVAKYQTASDIENAKRSDGKLVFPNGVKPEAADAAAKNLQKMVEVYDSLPNDGTAHPTARATLSRAVSRNTVLLVQRNQAGNLVFSEGETALSHPMVAENSFLVAAGDLFSALESGAERIGEFAINALDDAFEFVVDLGGRFLRFVFEVGSQVLSAVNWVLKELLGIDLSEIIAWLGFVFDWGAILQTHRVIRRMGELTTDYGLAQLDEVKRLLDDGLKKVRAQITGGGITVDTSDEIFANRISSDPTGESKEDDDPQSSWAADHLSSGLADATSSSTEIVADIIKTITDLAETEGAVVQNAFNQVMTDVVEDWDTLTLAEVLDRLLRILAEALVNTAENIALTLIDLAEVVIEALRAIMETRWEIPVVTYVYEEIICGGDGSKLTLIDAISLVAAIPASVAYRAATGKPLFSDKTAKAIETAATFDEMKQALVAMEAPKVTPAFKMMSRYAVTDTSMTNERTAGEHALIVMQWLASCTRTGAAIAFDVRELSASGSKPKQLAAEWKVSFDVFTSTFGTIGTIINGEGQNWSLPARTWLDNAVTWSTWLFRIRDAALAIYWRKSGSEAPQPVRTGLSFVECGIGVAYVVMVAVSAAQQADEGPPSYLTTKAEKAAWTEALVFKTFQNELSAIYRVIAPAPNVLKGTPYELVAKGARMICLSVTVPPSFGRAVLESVYDFADLDF
jgi:hypothetical protein